MTHSDILHGRTINRLEGQAAAMLEGATADGDVAEAAIALGAQLDASCGAVTVGSLERVGGAGAIEERTYVVAADLTVLDEHMLGGFGPSQGVGALEHDGIVVDGVDTATTDDHALATIDVEAVAVGVGRDILDEQVVDSREQQGEMSASEEAHVTYRHVVAIAQGKGLVGLGHTRISSAGLATAEHVGAVDESLALDGHMVQAIAPEERVVPMAVSEVLVSRLVGLGLVVALAVGHGGGLQYGTFFDTQGDIAPQV